MNITKTVIRCCASLILVAILLTIVGGLPGAIASRLDSQADTASVRQTDRFSRLDGLNLFTASAAPQIDPSSRAGTSVVDASRLSAGTPQTITVQVTLATLIANSGLTATITATVVDADNVAVPDVTLSGDLSPASLGNANMLGPTDVNGEAIGIWTAGTSIGSGVLSIIDGDVTGTADVTLTVGSLSKIVVSPNSATVTVGLTRTFTADGFDQYNNPVAITPTWTTNSSGSMIDPTGIFTAGMSVQSSRRITAAQGLVADSAIVNLVAGPLSSIVVSPSVAMITVGTTGTFTANGFDQYDNPVVIAPTWTTNSPGSTIDAKGVFTASTSVQSSRRVTATQDLIADNAIVNIVAGPPAVLTISPATRIITAGLRVTYTALISDAFGNSLGNVSASTVFSISPSSGGTFAGRFVTPTVKGTYTVTGVYSGLTATAVLTVNPAAYARLSIEDAPAGSGNPIGATAISIYQTLSAYAVGYDQFNNLIGAISAAWGATGVLSGTLSPTSGVSTTLTPMAVLSGTGVITATSGLTSTATGLITIQAPILQISKTGDPDPVTPGGILQYTIIYTNAGNTPAHNVVVTETYPLSTTYQSSFSNPPLTMIGNNVWQIGDLTAATTGTINIFVKAASQFPVGSVLTNTVRIAGAKVNTAIVTATTAVNALPDVSVSLSDNLDPVRVGDTILYVIQYGNNGNAPVSGVRITNTFPSQVSFVSANPSPDQHDPGYSYGVWLTNTLGVGQSRFVFITVRVNSPINDLTQLIDLAAISTDQTAVYTTTESTLVQAPILALSKSASPNSPLANSRVTYTLQYTDSGSTEATNVVITDALPLNTSFVGCNGCIGPAGNVVTWNLNQVSSQQTGSITLALNVNNNLPNGLILTNTARISSTENVSAFASLTSTIVSAPALRLSLSDGVASAAASDVLTYSLTYANLGTAPAQSVVITDKIPANVSFLSCSPSCISMGNGVYSFTIGVVNAGSNHAVSLSVAVNPTLPAGLQSITTTAAIRTTTPGDDPADNFAQDVDSISTIPALALGIGFDSTTPYETKVVTYSVRYTNTSAMDTTGVVITVTRSPFVTDLSTGWSTNGADQTFPIGSLPAFASGNVTYVVSLPITFTSAMTAFINQFVIQDNGPGGLPVASAVNAATIGVPDLVISSVSLSPSNVVPGQKFTATVTVRNQGTGRACNPKHAACISGAPAQQGGTLLSVFITNVVPPSFPYSATFGFGNATQIVPQVGPGLSTTVMLTNLTFNANQMPVLYFKIDNYDCNSGTCLPSSGQRGLIPESNEYNNVFGPYPDRPFKIYLPLIRK